MAFPRTPLFVLLLAMGIAACSLFVSIDDLSSGSDAGLASDASSDAATADVSDAAAIGDAQSGLLSCDASGLVAYWSFDEGSGTIVHDCHQGLDGMLAGDASIPTWGTRVSDAGSSGDLEFKNDSYVDLGVPLQIELPGPFTLSGWLRADNLPSADTSILWDYDGNSHTGFEVTLNSANLL